MISSGHKNTRDDNDYNDLESGKECGRLHGLVLLGGFDIVLMGDVNALKENEKGGLSHLRAEGRPNLDGAIVGCGRARRNT